MRDLVLHVQIKNWEKHPWTSITFSKVAGSKSNTHPWASSRAKHLMQLKSVQSDMAELNYFPLQTINGFINKVITAFFHM